MYWLSCKKRVSLKSLNICELKSVNWHIQWNEHLALELSYDLGLGCTHLFFNSIDYDSSYPWIRLTFVHLMGVRPVQTYYWKTNVSISLPNPTSDNAMNMSIGFLSGFLLVWPQSLERAKNRFFWAGERLRDYFYWKITHPLPIVHNLWKFELSITYGLHRAKIAYFGVVRGCVTIFCEKSRILFLFWIICENLSFPSFTV